MVRDLQVGAQGMETFLCSSKQEGLTKRQSRYLSIELQDSTGIVQGKIWDLSCITDFSVGDAVEVSYLAESYQDVLQLKVLSCRKVEVLDYGKFVLSSKYDTKQMFDRVRFILGKIQNPWLRALVNSFLDDVEFVEAFCSMPAAVRVHHAYRGGLLQHTLFVMRNAHTIAKIYSDSINCDLVLTAAFLHDIGKVLELTGVVAYEYSKMGNILGHISIGVRMIEERCKGIDGFPPEICDSLVHCILAHHGSPEFGSPVKPALQEAVILHFADNLDSTLETFRDTVSDADGVYSRYLSTTLYRTEGFDDLQGAL